MQLLLSKVVKTSHKNYMRKTEKQLQKEREKIIPAFS